MPPSGGDPEANSGLTTGMMFLTWEHIGTLQEDLESLTGERDALVSLLNLLP